MIWLRRGLSVPLVSLLFLLLIFALVSLQANCTLLRAAYYAEVLKRVDFYEFLLTDVAASALDEIREMDGEAPSGVPDELSLASLAPSTEDMVSSVNVAFPPEWVQANIEVVVDELVRYITGERDEFAFTIQAGDEFSALVSELKVLLRESGTFETLFEVFVIPAVTNAIITSVPTELNITSEQATASAHRIVPRDWYEPQVEGAIDEITPYLVGEEDSFQVNVPLDDRVEVAIGEFKTLLRDAEAYETLYQTFVEPMVEESFGNEIELPYGIVLTKAEIVSAMREVAPPSWIQAQFEKIVDDSTPYLKGETDSFATEISLVDNKTAAVRVVDEVARRKLRERLESLPECAADRSLGQIISEGFHGTITCIPPSTPTDMIANAVGREIAVSVENNILNSIPDSVVFTEADLQETLSGAGIEESADVLDGLRTRVREGWNYTDVDFNQDIQHLFLDAEQADDTIVAVEDLRTFLSEGWTYTHQDFREDLGDRGGEQTLSDLDRVRSLFKIIRTFGVLVAVSIAPLVAGIGFLGGQDWKGRSAWAFGSLLVASVLALFFIMLVHGLVIGSRLDILSDTLAVSGAGLSPTEALVTSKVLEIARTISDDFTSGVLNKGLILVAVGIFGLCVSLGWEYIAPLARRVDLQRLMRR